MKLWVESKSQSFQESFVLNMTQEKRDGYYVEVGSNHPTQFSNTALLEAGFSWKGFGLELSSQLVSLYNAMRSNSSICADATKFDYLDFLRSNNYPPIIDYLQLDIEPAAQTFSALLRIPFKDFKFRVITYEHDLCADTSNLIYKEQAFELLSQYSYKRIVNNVQSKGNPYEDWYIHPDLVSEEVFSPFENSNIEDYQIFSNAILI